MSECLISNDLILKQVLSRKYKGLDTSVKCHLNDIELNSDNTLGYINM